MFSPVECLVTLAYYHLKIKLAACVQVCTYSLIITVFKLFILFVAVALQSIIANPKKEENPKQQSNIYMHNIK